MHKLGINLLDMCLFPRLNGISSTLPHTAGIKMIEIFLLFSLTLTLNDVLLQTYVYYWVNPSLYNSGKLFWRPKIVCLFIK
jgi:hypothetical protein